MQPITQSTSNATRKWQRVTSRLRCPICGRDDYCGISPDGIWAICMRVHSPKQTKNGGYLHRIGGSPIIPTKTSPSSTKLSSVEWSLAHKHAVADISPERITRLAKHLKVSEQALVRLGIGWHTNRYTFPMQDCNARIIGMRTRHADGSKRCVTGSRLGLFVPIDLPSVTPTLLICEGESDTAAALDLGQEAIARPGCQACRDLICEFCHQRQAELVVIVADADDPGQIGAHDLARRIAAPTRRVRVLTPPDGAKDLRAWKAATDYATHQLEALIDAPGLIRGVK